jgi:hypothetical protein
MPEKEYRYILRYMIDHEYLPEERIEEIAVYCKENGIQEVMLFINAEELFEGHVTSKLLADWLLMAKKLNERLKQDDIDISVNPWTTTVHCARGRKIAKEFDFRLMVGETGVDNGITACPLCENWQQYLCDVFSAIAKELKPVAIWVEDDWRLHNHGDEMVFGGCFCDHHMAEFSKKVGQEVTREEMMKKVLAPGAEIHPWRKIWLDLWQETLLEPARKARDAVKAVSPDTALALMSSGPDVHSVEGRDWHALQEALGDDPIFMARPHLPPYTETRALDTTPANTRLTIANLNRPLEIYPELENSPRNGLYTKSHNYSVWECLHSACYGSHGITINHFDMLGTGTALDPGFGPALKEARKRLDTLVNLGIDDDNSQGVDILFSPDVARHINSKSAGSFNGLRNNTPDWSQTLYILGISHRFVQTVDSSQPVAVGGQTLRAISDKEIKRLLSGTAILDAESCKILLERGYGKDIGIESAEWRKLEELGYSFEKIFESDPAVYGVPDPRTTAQRCASELLEMKSLPGADIRSMICLYDRSELFPGLQVFKNELGGTVISIAYPLGQLQFFMGFFTCFRRIFMQNLLKEHAPESSIAMAEERPMHVYRAKTDKGTLVAAINSTTDFAPGAVLCVNNLPSNGIKQLDKEGRWQNFSGKVENHGSFLKISTNEQIAPLDGLFLLFPNS